jgi:hypothetical protein
MRRAMYRANRHLPERAVRLQYSRSYTKEIVDCVEFIGFCL